MARPTIEPVDETGLPDFAAFLHENLNPAFSPEQWQTNLGASWGDRPNYGFVMRDQGRIVGGIGAIYASRLIRGREARFCNITSWCVLDDYRKQSMRLAMALVQQEGYTYTDLTPTEVVGGVLRFLKFLPIDERQTVALNLPAPFAAGRIVTQPESIQRVLTADALKTYRDHLAYPWLRHCALGDAEDWCHIVYKPRRLQGLPVAQIIHCGDPVLFNRYLRRLTGHLLLRGFVATLIETRRLTRPISPSRERSGFNAKLYRSDQLDEGDIDFLYSELVSMNL